MPTPPSSATTIEFYGEAFFNEMRAGREPSRRLADCIHEVIGEPQSAVDLGSGVGIQTVRLKELGWDITGADFAPLALEMRESGVEVTRFDLTVPHGGGRIRQAVDCVICTEVAEHVPGEYADTIVENIVKLARKFIVWSAAPPGQGGTGHVNCQPPEYWLERFKAANWVPSGERTGRLRLLMRQREAQHHHYSENFFVLLPIDNTEEFYAFMKGCRDNYRKLADCMHEVVGKQETAIDIGCGVGGQTARLQEHGWGIVGADFAPVAIAMREPGIEIFPFDLTKPPAQLVESYSCVICTEVAEHIPAEHADTIVDNVTALAPDVIIWSAACPWQTEPYHINLQPPAYWLKRFSDRGWRPDLQRSAKLQRLMLERQAQHVLGRENFFVLMPAAPMPHFTIVSTVLNAQVWITKCLWSVQQQTLLNWKHIVIDADSDDETAAVVRNFLAGPDVSTELHVNETRKSALENCWEVWKDLPDDEVIVWLDGDDWLAHNKALEVIAQAYRDPNVWMTFGQFMFSDGEVGFASPYPPGVNVRYDAWRATHLKTFRAGLVKKLNPKDLLRPDGEWVSLAIDKAVMWPLLEMAGDRNRCIYQIVSVYNMEASWAANRSQAELQVELDEVERLRALPPYERLTERPW